MADNWPRETIRDRLADRDDLVPQSPLEQRAFKLSYMTAEDPAIGPRIEADLMAAGLSATVIHSHGCYLDILPQGVSKAGAVAYLRCQLGLSADQVIVAGDSGNDIDMLRDARCSIIVGNARAELTERSGLGHAYRARATHGQGVVEGMQYFLPFTGPGA